MRYNGINEKLTISRRQIHLPTEEKPYNKEGSLGKGAACKRNRRGAVSPVTGSSIIEHILDLNLKTGLGLEVK